MFCRKCGNKMDENCKFCGECGTSVIPVNNTPSINNQFNTPINTNVYQKKKSKTPLILGVCFGLMILLFFFVFIIDNGKAGTKTIMIYMSGADLESNKGLGSFEKNSLDPNKIDLNKINVLLLAGGSPVWHDNSIAIGEVALFKLEKTGFKKIKTYTDKSLGNSSTLLDFLNYSYNNYKAGSYDFIFWDHGMGALGNISDDNANDKLFTHEMKEAFNNSPFKGNNKLDSVTFRTCLNSTVEIAYAVKDSAKYMIASEEISQGGRVMSALDFINRVLPTDDGFEFGKKFILNYKETLTPYIERNPVYDTYSIIDLSKFDDLLDALEDFSKSIDLTNTYIDLSRVRSNLNQYAFASAGAADYDTVDLYDFISKVKQLNPSKAEKILSVLDKMVVYNWTNNDYSHGISIYFPYRGSQELVSAHLTIYNMLNFAPNYKNLITKYYGQKATSTPYAFSFVKNTQKVEDSRASLKLNDEQKDKFSRGQFIVFEKIGNGYFKPILSSDDVSISDDGTLNADIDNKFVQVNIKGDWEYFNISKMKTGNGEADYVTSSMLFDLDGSESGLPKGYAAEVHLKIKNDEPVISQTILKNKTSDGSYTFQYVDYLEYDTINIWSNKYKVLDKNGKYTEKWENENGNIYFYETRTSDLKFRLASLDNKDNYYVLFKIYDINNNYYYSNLLKVK